MRRSRALAPAPRIPRKVVPSARRADLEPAAVAREFRRLSDGGARLRPVGEARRDPAGLLRRGYTPRHKLELFGLTFYLTDVRQNRDIRFFVAYVVMPEGGAGPAGIHPRLFYKDGSLLWRVASHYARSERENWIGKGDIEVYPLGDGTEQVYSAEYTTDLPLELQDALEKIGRMPPRVRRDFQALALVVRRGSDSRIEAFADFTAPRRRARSNPRNRVNGGRPIARFARRGDPESLRFARGYEPDFAKGVLERSRSTSKLYQGDVDRYRILSDNRLVQYLFFSGPHHVWIGHPQATTTELSSFGARTIDLRVPEELVVPGMEYHYLESRDPPVWVSQIPQGYVGETSAYDPFRADASAWLDCLPVIRDFRREVLGRGAGQSKRRPR
jgi:hypothetical protein